MSYSYFANEFFLVSQETNLHAEGFEISNSLYDYVFEINVAQDSLNNLFNTRQFIQNSNQQNNNGENNVDINLVVNRQFIDSLFITNKVKSIGNSFGYLGYETGILSDEKMIGLRFLEVVAMKIFGHAKARSAISNDKDFYRGDSINGSLISQMITGIQSSINTKKHDIFNQYVRDDRIEDNSTDDVDVNVNFNLYNSSLSIPMYFLSTLDINSNIVDLQNGPTSIGVGGVATMVNGSMNVPILVKFKSYIIPPISYPYLYAEATGGSGTASNINGLIITNYTSITGNFEAGKMIMIAGTYDITISGNIIESLGTNSVRIFLENTGVIGQVIENSGNFNLTITNQVFSDNDKIYIHILFGTMINNVSFSATKTA
jgi:hypothetical protein